MTAPVHPDPLQWRERLLREITLPAAVRDVPLEEAIGAVLGGEVRSPQDIPAVPIAAMDGFAVRRADLQVGSTTLPVSQELPARPGGVPALEPGSVARIMTGAPVPAGADAVVEVERTDADPFGPAPQQVTLTLEELPPAGRHVRAPGEEVACGTVLAEPGDRVGPGLVGLAATLGITTLPVRRPVRVAVVVTGDELAGQGHAGDLSVPGTVRESNSAMLTAALRADGAEATAHHSTDDPEELRRVLAVAAESVDLVVTTGGIGRGAFDVVKLLLGERGERSSDFTHLALRPGGPQGVGTLPGGTPVIHLPGTPVGALVGYHLFVRPLLPGAGGALRRVELDLDSPGGLRPLRGRPGTVHAEAALLGADAEGRETARILPGRRLAPYGRAQAIVLRRTAEPAVVLALTL